MTLDELIEQQEKGASATQTPTSINDLIARSLGATPDGLIPAGESTAMENVTEVARALGRSADSVYEMASDLVVDPLEALIDPNSSFTGAFNPFGAPEPGDIRRQKIRDEMTIIKPTIEQNPEVNPLLTAATTAAEYMAPGALASGGRKIALETIVPAISAAGGEYLANLTASGGEQSAAAPYAETASAIIGSLFTGVVDRKLIDPITNAFKGLTGKDLPGAPTAEDIKYVTELILQTADDSGVLVARYFQAMDRGDEGTMADILSDPNVANILKTTVKGSPEDLAKTAAQQRRDAQIETRIDQAFGEGDANAIAPSVQQLNQGRIANVGESTRGKQAVINANANEGLAQSRQRLETSEDALQAAENQAAGLPAAPEGTPAAQGAKLQEEIASTAELFEENVTGPAWDAFKAENNIDTNAWSEALTLELDALFPIAQANIRSDFKKEIDALENLGDVSSPGEVWAVVSEIKRKLSANPELKSYEANLAGLNSRVDALLEASPAGAAYTAAKESSRAKTAITGGREITSTRARLGGDESALFAGKLGLENGGPKAAVNVQRIVDTGVKTQLEELKNTYRAIAAREPVDAAFMAKHEDSFNAYPELKAEMDVLFKRQQQSDATASVRKTEASAQTDIAGAQKEGLAQTRANAAKKKKAIRGAVAGKFAEDPTKTINDIFNSNDPVKGLQELVKQVTKNPTFSKLTARERKAQGLPKQDPTMKQDLKKQIGANFIDRIARDNGVISPKLQEQFDDLRPTLAEIMSKEELGILEEWVGMTKSVTLNKAAGAPPISPASGNGDLYSSLIASQAMRFIPNMVVGSPLVLAGAVKRFVKREMTNNPSPQVQASLLYLIENPKAFEQAFKDYNPKTARAVQDMLRGVINNKVGKAVKGTVKTVLPAAAVQNTNDDELF